MTQSPLLRKLRFDHPGSYLRPKHLLQARKDAEAGTIAPSTLRAIEDEFIADLVSKELKAGMKVVTDGEARRAYFHLDFLKQLDGSFPNFPPHMKLILNKNTKYTVGASSTPTGITVTQNTLDSDDATHTPPILTIVDRVKHVRPIQLDDFLYLQKHAGNAVPKVCIPSPTMAHFRGGRAAISEIVYPEVIPSQVHAPSLH